MNTNHWLVEFVLATFKLIFSFLILFLRNFIKTLFIFTLIHILFVEFLMVEFNAGFCIVSSALITLGYCLFLTYAIFKEVTKNGDKKEN